MIKMERFKPAVRIFCAAAFSAAMLGGCAIVSLTGQHSIALLNSDDGKPLLVVGNAGEKVFLEVAADTGLFATRFSLRRIAEDEGRRKALAGKMINDVRGISRP